ncbi:MAG: hypothetical protein ABJA83_04405 [Burkholderiaceae bacterium]
MMLNTRNAFHGVLAIVTIAAALPVLAANLDANALQKLTSGKTWSATKIGTSTQPASFEWKVDGTVCLRLGQSGGKCDDQGTWKIVGQGVCYQMTWWLKSYDLMSSCLAVEDLGKGDYEAKLPTGGPFFKFKIT